MTKLEKKLLELNYELAITQKFIPENKIVKTYSKKVGENLFNEILITKEGIYQTRALDEKVMQKDLEVLKQCQS